MVSENKFPVFSVAVLLRFCISGTSLDFQYFISNFVWIMSLTCIQKFPTIQYAMARLPLVPYMLHGFWVLWWWHITILTCVFYFYLCVITYYSFHYWFLGFWRVSMASTVTWLCFLALLRWVNFTLACIWKLNRHLEFCMHTAVHNTLQIQLYQNIIHDIIIGCFMCWSRGDTNFSICWSYLWLVCQEYWQEDLRANWRSW